LPITFVTNYNQGGRGFCAAVAAAPPPAFPAASLLLGIGQSWYSTLYAPQQWFYYQANVSRSSQSAYFDANRDYLG
jgi:hypothetical protein